MLTLSFHGGAKMVTGANYLLEVDSPSNSSGQSTRILVDCGLHQGSNFCERHNWEPFPYDPKTIDAVFVTHAHIDHTGRLPKLVKDGFRGKVYSNPATRDAAELLLYDSDHILSQEAEKFKKPRLYDERDVAQLMELWEPVEYHAPVILGDKSKATRLAQAPAKRAGDKEDGMTVTFYNAGHILGSSFLVVDAGKERIVFSGDLGNSPAPIIGAREEFSDGVTYAVIESTYGDRVHERSEERKEMLEDAIEDVATAGGTLLIPAFAMERTQELLYELNDLVEHGRIPKMPVFIDSPLAIKLTEVYRRYERYFTKDIREEIKKHGTIFFFPGLTMTPTPAESKKINDVKPPKVVIAGSGMSHGGRILHHEKRYLQDPKSMLLIVGYQAHGSLGRMLLDGALSVRIMGEEIPVRCKVKAIGAYSAHADQPQLLEWLAPMRATLKKVFVVQGEETAANALSEKISDELAVHTHVPSEGEQVVL